MKIVIFNKIIGINYQKSNKSIFLTILNEDYEIHIQIKSLSNVFYSVFKKDECLEVGNNSLMGIIFRVKEITKNNTKLDKIK